MTPPRLLAAALGLAVLAGCTSEPAPAPTPSPSEGATAIPTNDPDREALAAMVAELETTVDELRAALEAAAAGEAGALDDAIVLLVAEPDVVTDAPLAATDDADDQDDEDGAATGEGEASDEADVAAPTPGGATAILPGPLTSREESIQYGDLLTRTLAAARGAGSAGEPVLRFLADPLAGDLGAWQRAPADQLDAIARAGTAPDLAATETAVLDLDGEAPRALAWVVHGLTVPADAEDAAGRALAHLAIIDLALDQLT